VENPYGLTGLIFAVCKETCSPIREVYCMAITEFLYYASYITETEQKRIRELKKLKLKK
jgi:hypothetical protein